MNRRIVALLSAVLFATASACGTKTDNAATATPTPSGNAPVVSASASTTSGMAPLIVAFSGVAAGGVGNLHYDWDFGDGAVAADQNPGHTYTTDGTFTATFKATDSTGAFGTATVTVNVGARNAPAVTATADHTSGLAPLIVHFTSSVTGGTAPMTTSWNFGDGETAAEVAPAHTFNTAGSYGATVTVHDASGATASATVLIQVGGGTNPVVAVSANPTSGAAPLLVTFTTNAAGGNGALTYAWTFGDGATATVANPTHTFTANGSWVSKVTVKDANNNTATANVTIVVNNASSTMPDFRITNINAFGTGLNDAYEPNDAQAAAHYLGDFGAGNVTYTVADGYLDTVDVTYYADVVNFGGATTTPFYVDFYQNRTLAPADGVFGDDYQQLSGLAANATTRVTFTHHDVAPDATNTVWFKADSLTQVSESVETNNVSDGLDVSVLADEDWFSVYEDAGFALKVTLTTLPADYDIALYNQAGTLVASSVNTGTTNESITYTTPTTGMYYVRVLGYQGARNSASPYTLKVLVP